MRTYKRIMRERIKRLNRKPIRFDLSKLTPGLLDMAQDYFATEEFDIIRKKYSRFINREHNLVLYEEFKRKI